METANGDGFVFDETAHKKRVSDDEIVRALKRFARQRRGRAFSMQQFAKWAGGEPCHVELVRERFGGWRAALERAGIREPRCGKYSAQKLMEILEDVWRKTRMPPTGETLRKVGNIGTPAYARIWGSHREARTRLAKFRRGEISREEMMAPVRRSDRPGPGRGRSSLPVSLRWRVLVRDGQKCVVCGASRSEGARLEVDHIVPVSRGGGDEMENLRALCRECNRGRGDRISDVKGERRTSRAGRGRRAA